MAREQTPIEAHDALDNLVNQFSDPMSFFRELLQNALDAGTPEIEVFFEYQPGEGDGDGIMIVHVDDFGEGMDREIIDTRLTRLFSSSKDGDLTKIGRFGIGFVSVFAIQPDAVCLDTSRGGENWRILFQKDRSFHRISRDEPVDGTKIQIIKTLSEEAYEAFVKRAREVLSYWCKHAASEILFEGETINEPFDIDAPCKVRQKVDDTEVVVGFAASGEEFFGFYNKGLTLHEEHKALLPGVVLKINSRYLEHTLTRDNVLQDDNYHKAVEIARKLAGEPLRTHLYTMLAEAVAAGETGAGVDFLYHRLAWLVGQGQLRLRELDDRVFYRTLSGEQAPMGEIRKAFRRERLFWENQASLLTTTLAEEECLVLQLFPKTAAFEALSKILGQEPSRASRFFCCPVPPQSDAESLRRGPLGDALRRLLERQGSKLSDVTFGHFHYPGSSIRREVAITQGKVGELTPSHEVKRLGASLFSRRRVLVVNADHPTVERLVGVAQSEPELAAYLLAKLFFLRGELSTALDGKLLAHSIDQRRGRRAVEQRRAPASGPEAG